MSTWTIARGPVILVLHPRLRAERAEERRGPACHDRRLTPHEARLELGARHDEPGDEKKAHGTDDRAEREERPEYGADEELYDDELRPTHVPTHGRDGGDDERGAGHDHREVEDDGRQRADRLAWSGKIRHESGPGQTDFGRDGGEGVDDERDVDVQIDAELGGAPVDVVAVHRARESLVFELFPYRRRLEPIDHLSGTHERTGVDEAGQLVAGIERTIEHADARAAGIVGVSEDRVHDRGI